MSTRSDRQNHALCCALTGTALGDAWGYPHEFNATTGAPTPLLTSGVIRKHLVISDDTQMSLALTTAMDTVGHCGYGLTEGASLIAEQFVAYNSDKDNNRAPGSAVTQALRQLERRNDPGQWPSTTTSSGGCGAVMRLAPAVILAPPGQSIGWSVTQGRITHDSSLARAACVVLALAHTTPLGANLIEYALSADIPTLLAADTLLEAGDADGLQDDLHTAEYRRTDKAPLQSMMDVLDATHQLYDEIHTIDPGVDGTDIKGILMSPDIETRAGQRIGPGWDAASAVATALLVAQLQRDYAAELGRGPLTALDAVEIAAHWVGDRDSRAAIVGGLIGATLQPNWALEFNQRFDVPLRFERRYDKAIRTGFWAGFPM